MGKKNKKFINFLFLIASRTSSLLTAINDLITLSLSILKSFATLKTTGKSIFNTNPLNFALNLDCLPEIIAITRITVEIKRNNPISPISEVNATPKNVEISPNPLYEI